MHPTTRKIIALIRAARIKPLTIKVKDAREAKNRMDALRRAKKRGYVTYEDAHQQGSVLRFGLR